MALAIVREARGTLWLPAVAFALTNCQSCSVQQQTETWETSYLATSTAVAYYTSSWCRISSCGVSLSLLHNDWRLGFECFHELLPRVTAHALLPYNLHMVDWVIFGPEEGRGRSDDSFTQISPRILLSFNMWGLHNTDMRGDLQFR